MEEANRAAGTIARPRLAAPLTDANICQMGRWFKLNNRGTAIGMTGTATDYCAVVVPEMPFCRALSAFCAWPPRFWSALEIPPSSVD